MTGLRGIIDSVLPPVGFGAADAVVSPPIDEWFVRVDARVYDEVAYRMAMIGNETSGLICANPTLEWHEDASQGPVRDRGA